MTAPELSFLYSLGTSRERALHSVRRDVHSMIPESPLLLSGGPSPLQEPATLGPNNEHSRCFATLVL